MNHDPREWQAQQCALEDESRGAPAGDPHVDRYRAVFRAIAQAPRSGPPADFAAGVLAAVAASEREERIERWVMRVLGALVGIGVALYAGPTVLEMLGPATDGVPMAAVSASLLKSPQLWAAAAAAATAGIVDRLAGRGEAAPA